MVIFGLNAAQSSRSATKCQKLPKKYSMYSISDILRQVAAVVVVALVADER